ncbi:MAG: glutamate--tRNA ligase [Dehalococcoidia bacterium]|nr:glutamate--tRNA ligase [Dehalococcoidia bacterium]
MTNQVRVRYAPSPTGDPHVGNIRTALFSWLYARHTGGKFIVRIEDTDVSRTVEGALESILGALEWLDLDWDEGPKVGGNYGPYVQSERLDLYKDIAEKLVAEGKAYYCYCTPERLRLMREDQTQRKQPPGYDRTCRDLTKTEIEKSAEEQIPHVIRFKFPVDGETSFNDLIRGEVKFSNHTVDDFVMLKSDGYPTYHLANVVDDHLMDITHVLRAEEWLSSTPKHVKIYDALGYNPPLFAHLPLILGPDRSKLSKRHGEVSVLQYRDMGYLPEAMFNFLALLGWSLDDHTELMSISDLIDNFSIERIGKAGAIFSLEKLTWMNGTYIRQMSSSELSTRIKSILDDTLPDNTIRPISLDYINAITPLIHERLKTMSEVTELVDFFFLDIPNYPPEGLIQKGMDEIQTLEALRRTSDELTSVQSWNAEKLENILRPLAEKLEVKTGQLFGSIRVAITGKKATPPLFETMEVLGEDICKKRINDTIASLE